ncbi:hypothetical protein TNCV_4321581 [Trichonephila clavipes]|uniref:Uncharacterized protein n=1 Tax=Trichonephila clavipes TaxID=2585209 RepID=A0A8X6S9Q8_TRICX|nr:hypothetical protein TNCV_4321581 [Trichonephila clavipes]
MIDLKRQLSANQLARFCVHEPMGLPLYKVAYRYILGNQLRSLSVLIWLYSNSVPYSLKPFFGSSGPAWLGYFTEL